MSYEAGMCVVCRLKHTVTHIVLEHLILSKIDGTLCFFKDQTNSPFVIIHVSTSSFKHRLPVRLVVPAVLAFGRELMAETKGDASLDLEGRRLGTDASKGTSVRERALAAAERRAREEQDKSD